MRVAPCVPSTPPPVTPNDVSKTPPVLPPPNTQSAARPLISSPVLDNTTSSTVKELIKKEIPARRAPPVPSSVAKANRPNSTPGTLEANLEDVEVITKPSPKEQSMTLNRIASFISKSSPYSSKSEDKRDGVALKAAKIDKDTLKNLKISDPIPLSEPTIPVNPLPLSKEQEKNVVMRAQSLRQNTKKERPSIHSFGSVRLAGSRRPTSIPACSRPTSPPPCPPSQTSTQSSAKLAYCNSYPSSEHDTEDNIYAVIEESPTDEEKTPENSPSSKKPATLANTSDGLLTEIVNEIQARNMDSIYSTHHPVKKTSSQDDPSSPDKNQLYENTSYTDEYPKSSSSSTNSGYMMPIRTNTPNKSSVTSSKMQVPEKSAPGYKPFSDSKKQITPIVASLHTKSRLSSSETEAKSSQDTAAKKVPSARSTISSTISKFQSNDDEVKPKPSIIKPKPAPGKMNSKPAKAPSVASIQQKFETQAKTTPRSSFNGKVDTRSSFKK